MHTTPLRTLDDRITNLRPDIDERIREDLLHCIRTLRGGNPTGVFLAMTRLSLHLLEQTFARSDKARPSDNLYDCIVTAAGGDELKRIRGHRLLPDEIASCLHTLRILSNKADHLAEGIKQTANRAENALNLFLDAVEWYYCEYERGPRLPTIYSESQYRTPELEIISVYCTDEYELDVTLRNTADQPVFRGGGAVYGRCEVAIRLGFSLP